MRQKLFTTLGANADFRYMIRWSQEPPRRRTVLVDDDPPTERWSLPWVVFGEVYDTVPLRHRNTKKCLWNFVMLLVYVRGKPITASSDNRLTYACLPNAYSGDVCLGTSERKVREGLVSAPDAFWNSVFTDTFEDHSIEDCLKRGHTRRYLEYASDIGGTSVSEVLRKFVEVNDPW